MDIREVWWGGQTKKIEMGRAFSTHGEEEKSLQGFSGETWEKEATRKTQT